MTVQLELRDVAVAYGHKPVLDEVSFALDAGRVGCLVGPSGCGKTTLLRAIAGFEPVAAGEIRLGGRVVAAPGRAVPPEERRVGMVFQDFALFPHLTAAGNVAFGLRSLPADRRRARVREVLGLVGLADAAGAYPHQLSGGEQQRVALARAMAPRPDILLMDEPFSNADASLREQLAHEVRRILLKENMTAVLVTHDQLEAFAIADTIGVLGGGWLRQWACACCLYHEPADRFVADFIGEGVVVEGRMLDGGRVETPLGTAPGRSREASPAGSPVQVLLRPSDLVHDDTSRLRLQILGKTFRGTGYMCTLRLPDGRSALCAVPVRDDSRPGDTMGVRLTGERLTVFPAEAGHRRGPAFDSPDCPRLAPSDPSPRGG